MLIVHHLNDSRSHRVIHALEELGLAYSVQNYQRNPRTMLAPPELAAIHPLGLSPVLEHHPDTGPDAGQRVIVAESGAILEYLCSLQAVPSPLRPTQGQAGRDCTYWLHYAEGSLMPLLLLKLVMSKIGGKDASLLARPFGMPFKAAVDGTFTNPRLRKHFAAIDTHLASHAWFAGETFSIADVQMLFPVLAAAKRLPAQDVEKHQHIAAWLAKTQARPAWTATLGRVGPLWP